MKTVGLVLSKPLFRAIDGGIYVYALIDLCSCRLARDEGAMHDFARAVGRESDTSHAHLESLG